MFCTLRCPARHGTSCLREGFAAVLGEGGTCGRGARAQVGWIKAGVFSLSVCLSAWPACPCCCCFCTWAMQAAEVRCHGWDGQRLSSGTREMGETVHGRGCESWDRSRATKKGARGFPRPG